MNVRFRRGSPLAVAALAVLAFAACEDPETFTEPEHQAFTAVAIDKSSVLPREGSRLTAGGEAYEIELDIHWQNVPAGSVMRVWLELQDSVSGQTFRWEGDIDSAGSALASADGQTEFSGSFVLPEVSPFCGPYDYLRILTVVFPEGNAPPNEAYRDEVFYEVSGADWTGPCVRNVFAAFEAPAAAPFRIGEPIILYGRGLSDGLDVSLPGSQQDDNVWPHVIPLPVSVSPLPVQNDGYAIAFVPVGAETGRVRAFSGGSEVRYAATGEVDLTVSASADDALEPNNTLLTASDSIYFSRWDPWGFWGPYGFNPSLTLAGADRTPDPIAPDYGLGDYYLVVGQLGGDVDLCINVASHLGDADDIDLYVYNALGSIVTSSATVGGNEGVRIDDVSPTEIFVAWVTPYLPIFNSTAGGYSYEVGPCDNATGTGIARPDGPLGFRLEQPAGAAANLRVQRGAR